MTLPNFFDDAPVETLEQGKLLWADNKAIIRSIESVSSEIVQQENGLVYAIYGSWGSGKSSIAKIIEEQVGIKARAAGLSVVFCWYYASAYQDAGSTPPDIMFTLSLRILRTLAAAGDVAGRTNDVVRIYETYVRALLKDETVVAADDPDPRNYDLLEKLARRTGNLTEFPDFLGDQLHGQGPFGGERRKLVLMVDDLDRCTPKFIAVLLQTLRRLTDKKDLFVFLIGDRPRILSGVREMSEAENDPQEAERALEKYVNYAINVPPMDRRLLTQYVRGLVAQQIEEHKLAMDSPDYLVLNNLQEHAEYLYAGVRTRTPRAIKRAMNAVRPELQLLDDTTILSPDRRRLEVQYKIKRALLDYSFPEFCERIVARAETSVFAPERDFLFKLENACQHLFGEAARSVEDEVDRRARFEMRVNRYRASSLPAVERDFTIADELATLLALPPSFASYWANRNDGPGSGGGGGERFSGGDRGAPRDGSAPGDLSDVQDLLNEARVENRLAVTEEFTRYYLLSEQADAIGDGDASVRAAYNAFKLVTENRTVFGKSVASQLGNLGVNAEKYNQPNLAEAIFELAHQLDSDHIGVMQQYASFLIDNRPEEQALDRAESMLARLQEPPLNQESLSRTLSLWVQLLVKRDKPVAPEVVAKLVELSTTEPNLRRIGSIVTSLIRAGSVDEALEIYNQARQRFTAFNECIEMKRYAADALANRREERYDNIAMDIYQQMLDQGQLPDGEMADVEHNLATLYYKYDYDEDAGKLWYDAYKRRPNDGAIRRAYSSYLIRASALDEAGLVINSQPVDVMKLYKTSKTLPERFSDFEVMPCGGDPAIERRPAKPL